MKLDYNKLVQKVDDYLRRKRAGSRAWAVMLPERLFTPELWLWEPRSIAIGAAWGTSWAIAPVPMQMVFVILCCMATRSNIPIAVLSCCISFPGYQVFAWPLQWYVGTLLLGAFGLSSGISIEFMRQTAEAALQGWNELLSILQQVNLLVVCIELLTGCLITCALMWIVTYGLARLILRKR